jgi:hypothetical protein
VSNLIKLRQLADVISNLAWLAAALGREGTGQDGGNLAATGTAAELDDDQEDDRDSDWT